MVTIIRAKMYTECVVIPDDGTCYSLIRFTVAEAYLVDIDTQIVH